MSEKSVHLLNTLPNNIKISIWPCGSTKFSVIKGAVVKIFQMSVPVVNVICSQSDRILPVSSIHEFYPKTQARLAEW